MARSRAALARTQRWGTVLCTAPTRGRRQGCPRVTISADRALHLQLDQAVQLDRVLHRQLFGDRLDEPVDDHLRGLLLVEPAALQVEELLVADLRDRRLVSDVGVVLADPE